MKVGILLRRCRPPIFHAVLFSLLFTLSFGYALYSGLAIRADSELRETLTRHIAVLLRARIDALIAGDDLLLARFYDVDSKYGRWALDHERRRVKYVREWASKRGIRFLDAEVDFRIKSLDRRGNSIWVSLVQCARFRYSYDSSPNPHMNTPYGGDSSGRASEQGDTFAIGTRHTMEFILKDGEWLVRRDWYTDPLDEDTLVPEVRPAEESPPSKWPPAKSPSGKPSGSITNSAPTPPEAANKSSKPSEPGGAPGHSGSSEYNREAAVAYADRYWHEYNPKYKDYTEMGGDCTNFAAQVLFDPEAGGLPMDGSCYYRSSPLGGGGSRTWVQTEKLANYLLYSGHAKRIAYGHYQEVMLPSVSYPDGPIQGLEKGDLIGYEEKGRIEHFAIVVGRDSHGYVLVNSHTADRYHVPWDLGWDRDTKFWLLKIVR